MRERDIGDRTSTCEREKRSSGRSTVTLYSQYVLPPGCQPWVDCSYRRSSVSLLFCAFSFSLIFFFFFFSSRRRHTRLVSDWSSDVCSSDLASRVREARS